MEKSFTSVVTTINGREMEIASLSPHDHILSNGEVIPPQDERYVKGIRVDFKSTPKINKLGINLAVQSLSISEEGLNLLQEITSGCHLVVAPFMVISSLREMGIRDSFPNLVAYNATPETRRSAPQEKIVDINNWSY